MKNQELLLSRKVVNSLLDAFSHSGGEIHLKTSFNNAFIFTIISKYITLWIVTGVKLSNFKCSQHIESESS